MRRRERGFSLDDMISAALPGRKGGDEHENEG